MDLYQLRYFLEVARERNFTRAAERLHISPSAVSRSVALLERSVGKRLFARTKRQVSLSADGEKLKARAEKIFDEVERARLELAGAAQAPSVLRLGSREMITNYLLPEALRRFQVRWPQTRFEIYDLEPVAMAEALKKDRLDLGFYYADLGEPSLETRWLGSLRSHVYASKAFIKGGRPRTPREMAVEHAFIAPRAFGAEPSAARADGFPDQKLARKIQYEAGSLETHRRFVLASLCIGVLPDLVMREERRRGAAVILPGPAIHREVYFFRRKDRTLPKAAEFLPDAIKAAIRGMAAC